MSSRPDLIAGTFGIPLRIRTDFNLSSGGVFGEPTDLLVRVVRPDRSFIDIPAVVDDAAVGDVSVVIPDEAFPVRGDYEIQLRAQWGTVTRNLPSDIGVLAVGDSLFGVEEPEE
jgi:hypothetical protein